MFIFSLVVVREFNCLQPCKTNARAAIFDTKPNNVEAKANVAFFFGVNKISICMTAFVPNFHLNRHSCICLNSFTVHQIISNSSVCSSMSVRDSYTRDISKQIGN